MSEDDFAQDFTYMMRKIHEVATKHHLPMLTVLIPDSWVDPVFRIFINDPPKTKVFCGVKFHFGEIAGEMTVIR